MNKNDKLYVFVCPDHGVISERELEDAPMIGPEDYWGEAQEPYGCPVYLPTKRTTQKINEHLGLGLLREEDVQCMKPLEEIGLQHPDHDECAVLKRAEATWQNKYERPGRHEYNVGETISFNFLPHGAAKRYRIIDIDDNTGELQLAEEIA